MKRVQGLFTLLVFCSVFRAEATVITADQSFLVAARLGTSAAVDGTSSDHATFSKIDPDGAGLAFAAGSAVGQMGTVSAASALALDVAPFPAFAVTFAFTIAGPGQISTVESEAKTGASIVSSIVGQGGFGINIDPFMITEGDASALMSFALSFKGTTLFSGGAVLDHGVLTASGALSDTDFMVTINGSQTRADLVHTMFLVPFTISNDEVGLGLPFEFDQVFQVDAQNGGFAEVSSIPEPASIGSCLAGFFFLASLRMVRARISHTLALTSANDDFSAR
jgi:hypothetical protein